ncbi:MAG: cyclic nucleotide-binding domain-containing protein [Aestuariivirga sp.]|jgi:CRP-like cAMP-binding protein|nr:cyclic nucleotide-binding domain-containing protein [Aestuariivirga sp.]
MKLDQYDNSLKLNLPEGTVLLKQGTRSGKLYILIEGRVEVKREDTLVAAIDEPGAIFGEMSALLDVDHTANVIAATPVTVYRFDDAKSYLQSDPQVALTVARKLAQRLNTVTTYLVDLKRQYAGHSNHLGMVSEVLASLVYQQTEEFTPGSDRDPGP